MLNVDSTGRVIIGPTIVVQGGFADTHIAPNAGIQASKLQHEQNNNYTQVTGTAIVASTEDFHVVMGATGLFKSLAAAFTGVIASDVSRTVTVDIQRSTAGGAFATIMSSTVVINTSSTIRVAQFGVVNASLAALVQGDILRRVITVAGGSGSQAQGLVVSCGWMESTLG